MKYYLDTEFIENGETIDLISIGIVCEDGRTYYAQNANCKFSLASDWVWRNVFPHLSEFNMAGWRSCNRQNPPDKYTERCHKPECLWRSKWEIRDELKVFCEPEKFGKPEFWGYYCDYDWVAFCQLFGTMMDLPKGFPMYCRDVKQLCDLKGNPKLPASGNHNALDDAKHVQACHVFLQDYVNIESK